MKAATSIYQTIYATAGSSYPLQKLSEVKSLMSLNM